MRRWANGDCAVSFHLSENLDVLDYEPMCL